MPLESDVLRLHLEDGTFLDFPPDCGCSEGAHGLLFHLRDGSALGWYPYPLVHHVDRVPTSKGVTILEPLGNGLRL